jgi:hypothetical protein
MPTLEARHSKVPCFVMPSLLAMKKRIGGVYVYCLCYLKSAPSPPFPPPLQLLAAAASDATLGHGGVWALDTKTAMHADRTGRFTSKHLRVAGQIISASSNLCPLALVRKVSGCLHTSGGRGKARGIALSPATKEDVANTVMLRGPSYGGDRCYLHGTPPRTGPLNLKIRGQN